MRLSRELRARGHLRTSPEKPANCGIPLRTPLRSSEWCVDCGHLSRRAFGFAGSVFFCRRSPSGGPTVRRVAGRLAIVAVAVRCCSPPLAWASGGYFPQTWGAVLLAEAIVVAAVAILAERVELVAVRSLVVGGLLGLAAGRSSPAPGRWRRTRAARGGANARLCGCRGAAFLTVPRRRDEELLLGVLVGTATGYRRPLRARRRRRGAERSSRAPSDMQTRRGSSRRRRSSSGSGWPATGPRSRAALGAGVASQRPRRSTSRSLAGRSSRLRRASSSCSRLAVVALGRLVLAAIPCGAALVLARVGSFGAPGVSGRRGASPSCSLPSRSGRPRSSLVRRRSAVPRRVSRRVAVVVAAVVAVGVVVVGVHEVRDARSTPAASRAPRPALCTSTSSARTTGTSRAAMVGDAPLLGEGAGGFERIWLRDRPELLYVRDAHNLYLETLAEVGPVGLARCSCRARIAAARGPTCSATRPAARPRRIRRPSRARGARLGSGAPGGDGLHRPPRRGLDATRPATGAPCRPLSPLLRGASPAAAALAGARSSCTPGTARRRPPTRRSTAATPTRRAEAAERARRFAPWTAEPWQLLGEAEPAAGRLPTRDAHPSRGSRRIPTRGRRGSPSHSRPSGAERERAVGSECVG